MDVQRASSQPLGSHAWQSEDSKDGLGTLSGWGERAGREEGCGWALWPGPQRPPCGVGVGSRWNGSMAGSCCRWPQGSGSGSPGSLRRALPESWQWAWGGQARATLGVVPSWFVHSGGGGVRWGTPGFILSSSVLRELSPGARGFSYPGRLSPAPSVRPPSTALSVAQKSAGRCLPSTHQVVSPGRDRTGSAHTAA